MLEKEAAFALPVEDVLDEGPELRDLRSDHFLVFQFRSPVVFDHLLSLQRLVDAQVLQAVALGSLVGIEILPDGRIGLVLSHEVPLKDNLRPLCVLDLSHLCEVLACLFLIVDHLLNLHLDPLLMFIGAPGSSLEDLALALLLLPEQLLLNLR